MAVVSVQQLRERKQNTTGASVHEISNWEPRTNVHLVLAYGSARAGNKRQGCQLDSRGLIA